MSLPPLRQVITADTSQFDRAIGGAMGRLRRFAGPAGIGIAVTALTALTRSSMRSIDEIAKMARPLGIATDRFQAMAMVAQEAGVSQNSLANAVGRMQRVLVDATDGSASAARALDRLGVSVDQIRRLSPDEQFRTIAQSLNAIEDPTERAAAAMEVFGRSGREMINMLDDYGGALDEAADFQRQFGIAVSDEQAAAIERANDSLGRLGMAFRGLGNQLAVAVTPAVEGFTRTVLGLAGAIADRVTPPHKDFLAQLADGPGLVSEYEESLPPLSDSMDGVGNSAQTAAEKIERLNEAHAEYFKLLEDSPLRAGPLAFTPGEGADTDDLLRFLADPEAFSPTPAGVVVRDVTPGTVRPRQRPIDWLPSDSISSGLPGGAAVSDMMAERLEALIAGLQTEQETVDNWYAEGLEILRTAREQGLLTESEFMEQRERLEEEHQRRLAGIRQLADAQAVQDQNAFWNNITAAARQGGERMTRVVQALNASRALMNAWMAYTEVLADPAFVGRPWARAAAAAQVLSAGLGAVNAIRSVSTSGSGGGAGGATQTAQAQAQAVPVQRMVIETQSGGMIPQASLGGLIEQINEAGRQGFVIEAQFVGGGA